MPCAVRLAPCATWMRLIPMKVESTYFGELRELTRLNKENLTLKRGSNLKDLIDKLTLAYGNDFRLKLYQKNRYVILINGQNHEVLDGEKTILKEGDGVVFLEITMGG
jgi:molybdopterin converting factor small subunit